MHRGDLAALENFRRLGLALLNEHVLFDVVTDDHPRGEVSAKYQTVVTARDQSDEVLNLLPRMRSRFTAPATVRVSASRPAGSDREIDLHFVNYNRVEPSRGTDGVLRIELGIGNERPVAVSGIKVELLLPSDCARMRRPFYQPRVGRIATDRISDGKWTSVPRTAGVSRVWRGAGGAWTVANFTIELDCPAVQWSPGKVPNEDDATRSCMTSKPWQVERLSWPGAYRLRNLFARE